MKCLGQGFKKLEQKQDRETDTQTDTQAHRHTDSFDQLLRIAQLG